MIETIYFPFIFFKFALTSKIHIDSINYNPGNELRRVKYFLPLRRSVAGPVLLICHAIPLKQLDRILLNFRYMMKNIHVLCRCIYCLKFCLFFFSFQLSNFKFKSLPTLNSLLKNVYPRNFPEPVQQLASKHPTLMLTVAFGN